MPTTSKGVDTFNKKEYQKQYRIKHKEYLTEYNKIYQREYFKKNPDKYLFWSVKGRANRAGLPFDLKFGDIIIPDICPILGIKLQRNIGKLSRSQNSPSVDRIYPEKGYIKSNIQVISMRANVMKNDASPEELRRFAHWILKTFPV